LNKSKDAEGQIVEDQTIDLNLINAVKMIGLNAKNSIKTEAS
jgi:hypothetical protein